MIRLAFITDTARTVGYSRMNLDRTDWLKLLPEPIPDVMRELLYSENIAVSRNTFSICRPLMFAFYNTFILSTDTALLPPPGCQICNDHTKLISHFQDSPDELLVAGGKTTLDLFLPYATTLDVVETDVRIPGDTIFKDWDDSSFAIASGQVREGLRMLHYKKRENLVAV